MLARYLFDCGNYLVQGKCHLAYVECDFDSTAMPESFYLREIGIIANGVLCYYDNAREDAEFIDPASETLVKQKRMRFVLLISSELTVNVDKKSSLYALATDLQDVQRSMDEHMEDVANPHQVTKEQIELGNVDNTADMEKPISTAVQTALDLYYEQLTAYTDKAVADLVDGAPETMNTLKEVADALAENEDVTEALNAAIGTKANQVELDTHTGNTSIHVTPAEKNRWNNSLESDGDSVNNTVTFTSGDSISPNAWTDVALLKSGEKHSTIFNKVSTMFKNIRYLYKMLGNTDISAIGDGTATGAISELNTNLSNHKSSTSAHSWSSITNKPTSYTPSSHTHDERYYTENEITTKFYEVTSKSLTLSNGLDSAYWSSGTLYLEKLGRIVYISGQLRTSGNTVSGAEISVCFPTTVGNAFAPISGLHCLNAHILGSGKTCYVIYDPSTKSFRLQNQTGGSISAGTYIQFIGSYIAELSDRLAICSACRGSSCREANAISTIMCSM